MSRTIQAFLWVLLAPAALAQGGDINLCDAPGDYPDVAVTQLTQMQNWGVQDGKNAYSLQTTSCNYGTCWLNWVEDTIDHPVIAQNLYRIKDDRIMQLGQSWLKHGFFATSEDLCGICEDVPDGEHLGVNCSDPYSAFLNGFQIGLGPRYEVNGFTGDFPYPFARMNETGDTLDKRLGVANPDLDPISNQGSTYIVEGQYVAKDDAAAGRSHNNISSRRAQVFFGAGANEYGIQPFNDVFIGITALEQWPLIDPEAVVKRVPVPGEGQIAVGAKVVQLDGNTWRYEYAVHNMTSHRSIESFRVPVTAAANVQNAGFHAPEYHSGEIQQNTPWVADVRSWRVEWATEDYEDDPTANAIRWGTMYNFWFDADLPPVDGPVSMRLWLPGSPSSIRTSLPVPDVCNLDGDCDFGEDCSNCPGDCPASGGSCCGDGVCDGGEDVCDCPTDCGPPPGYETDCTDGFDNDCDGNTDCSDSQCCGLDGCGNGADADGDGFEACDDCDDSDGDSWARPEGRVSLLHASGTQLSFGPPTMPGGTLSYDVLRSMSPLDFIRDTVCLTVNGATADDPAEPAPNELFYYLVRGRNGCVGEVFMGARTDGAARLGRACF